MIPRDYVTAWRVKVPWVEDSQVEQDLIISRALVEIFSDRELASNLAAFMASPSSGRSGWRQERPQSRVMLTAWTAIG
jgi:hypothetical protein